MKRKPKIPPEWRKYPNIYRVLIIGGKKFERHMKKENRHRIVVYPKVGVA